MKLPPPENRTAFGNFPGPGSIALLCDQHGNLIKFLYDSLELSAETHPEMPFGRLAAPGGLAKALSFLYQINSYGAAFDWEINITAGNQVKTLHFAGGKLDDQILIVGAEDSNLALKLFEDMMRINNEQINQLRAVLKESQAMTPSADLYNEISRLNNELVTMQRELARKNAELAHLNQEKNHFLGMAAHDLRNPLYVTLNLVEFILDETTDEQQKNEFLQDIRASIEFMRQLVDDLLDVAKIESGDVQLEYNAIEIISLAQKNVARNRILAAKKQIEIDLEIGTLPRIVVVDQAKIEQVLNNLIGNAVKFSGAGSKVQVCLKRQEENFLLTVSDQGPGIARHEQEKLFAPFHRGSARPTDGEKSTGLGLMIVKRIVESHGGKIWLESEVGKGTTFFVLIPLCPPSYDQ